MLQKMEDEALLSHQSNEIVGERDGGLIELSKPQKQRRVYILWVLSVQAILVMVQAGLLLIWSQVKFFSATSQSTIYSKAI